MNISTNIVSKNINRQSLNGYGGNKPVCKNKDLVYRNDLTKQRTPFASYLNFTGGINKLGISKPSSLDSLIRSLIDFKGDNFEFAKHAFDKMKSHFGYEDLMHDNFRFVDTCGGGDFEARFNWKSGEFQMDREACLVLSRCEIASSLRHEFEHFFQFERMLRSEEVGLNGLLKEERARVVKVTDSECYILGLKVDPSETQELLNSYHDNLKYINVKFWREIVNSKGMLRKNTTEAKQAKAEFEGLAAVKPYIKLTNPEDKRIQPLFQESIYYDLHDIGDKYEYWTHPIEVLARKVEKEFLDKYVKLSNQPYIPCKSTVLSEKYFKAIEDFMNSVGSKFGTNNLPYRFKAYIYDAEVHEFLKENPKYTKKDVLACIKGACKRVRALTKKKARVKLLSFKNWLHEGKMRLNSQEETDDFMEFADAYMNS